MLPFLKFCEFAIIDCIFNTGDYWPYDGNHKYRCEVYNNPNISSKESAQIDLVNGTHMKGKFNNDEIFFHSAHKIINYIPSGLEKVFTNLRGIVLWNSGIKEVRRNDLKTYKKLTYLLIADACKIEVLEDGLFDLNPQMEFIGFENCQIFHIYPKIFDNLHHLKGLYFKGNTCVIKRSAPNATVIKEVIENVKVNCRNPDYSNLDVKFTKLEEESKNLNLKSISAYIVSLKDLQTEFNASKITNSTNLIERIHVLENKGEILEAISELKEFQTKQNETIENLNKSIKHNKSYNMQKMKSQNATIVKQEGTIESLKQTIDKVTQSQKYLENLNNISTLLINENEAKIIKQEGIIKSLKEIVAKVVQSQKYLEKINNISTLIIDENIEVSKTLDNKYKEKGTNRYFMLSEDLVKFVFMGMICLGQTIILIVIYARFFRS